MKMKINSLLHKSIHTKTKNNNRYSFLQLIRLSSFTLIPSLKLRGLKPKPSAI